MKHLYFIAIALCTIVYTKAQNFNEEDSINSDQNIKQYEIGYSFLTMNSNNYVLFSAPNELPVEFLNGVLFRYKINKLSFRSSASFYLKNTRREYSSVSMDLSYGDVQTKVYKIGIGIQHSLYRKKDVIYPYADLNYKRRFETGVISGVLSGDINRFKTYVNGLDLVTGIGSKLKVYKNLCFSAETGYNLYIAKRDNETVSFLTNEISYSKTNLISNNFLLKIYLSLVF